MASGFLLSGSTDTVWWLLVSCPIWALLAWSVCLLKRQLGNGDWTDLPGPALAVVLATSLLLEFGALLQVRLVIVPDPDDGFASGLNAEALSTGWDVLGKPLLIVAGTLLVCQVVASASTSVRWPVVARWTERMLRSIGADCPAGRERPGDVRLWHQDGAVWVLASLSLLFFLLPYFGSSNAGARLTLGPVAFAEYGKLLMIAALARTAALEYWKFDDGRPEVLRLIRQARSAGLRPRALAALFRETGFMVFPLGFFALVAVASALRSDFGTLIPAFAATVGVTWSVTSNNVRRAPSGGLRSTLSAYPLLRAFLLMIVAAFLAAGLFGDYVQERWRVWTDPWAYRWDTGCVVVAERVPAPTVPAGAAACQESLAAYAESERSQMSHVLSAIADGGLWGRGLLDTASKDLPVYSTDFILATIWSKLGGLVVFASALLIVLLGAGLVRTFRPSGHDRVPTFGSLFAAGFVAMLVGQYLFVYAATANLIPHSGIPAPLLSRGGQSTLALLLGVIAVVVLGLRQGTLRPALAGPARRRGRAGVWIPAAACAAITALATAVAYPAPSPVGGLWPAAYSEQRPPCPARPATEAGLTSAPPDPARCSTDRIAFNRTRMEIRFGDRVGLRQNRPELTWTPEHTADLGGLVPEDLAGLLRVRSGQGGVLEGAYASVVNGTAGTSLDERVSVTRRDDQADGNLTLTLSPRWQHRIATALRDSTSPETALLAGGVVVLDARTGEILVSASAPSSVEAPSQQTLSQQTTPSDPTAGEADDERQRAAEQFTQQHKDFATRSDGDGYELDDPDQSKETCRRQNPSAADQARCWRWSYVDQSDQARAKAASEVEMRRYVGNDPSVKPSALPSPTTNRALGKGYGLGSTFKVIIAAAYLSNEGTSAQDRIDAPRTLDLAPGVPIRNGGVHSTAACPGTVNEKITLAQALAVSCNTAFVKLARDVVGWPAIAAQAKRFGLRVGNCNGSTAWLGGPEIAEGITPAMGTGTCVPATVDAVSIGNNALGGGAVEGTPLGMATVMAAIANGGTTLQPYLVSSLTRPETARLVPSAPAARVAALPARAAAELRTALAGTAVDGTAKGLRDAVGMDLFVKTGTFERVPTGTALPRGEYVRDHSWIAGFVDTPTGPVAFAVVVEAPDQKTGSARARYLVKEICQAMGERR
ncbi:MAG: FtsW/RodA/SpoVE family cell cycle protein [Micromonosporaceae bacterium]|nr:FtsW/RodA/SpoVE family cell cycle protein [Micromonosporaceae bacterium]